MAVTAWTQLDSALVEHDYMVKRHDAPSGHQQEDFPQTPQRKVQEPSDNADQGLGLPNSLLNFKKELKG